MKFRHIIASAGLHAAVIGAVVGIYRLRQTNEQDADQPVPVFFEIAEEILAETPPTEAEVPEPTSEETPEANLEEDLEHLWTDREDPFDPIEDDGEAPSQRKHEAAPPQRKQEMTDEVEIPRTEPAEMAEAGGSEERAKVVSDPVALNRIVPVYPRSARRRGHEGSVAVEIFVTEAGAVSSAEIVSSSGHAELDSAALGAVRTARFAPATTDGTAVGGRLRLTFEFKLE